MKRPLQGLMLAVAWSLGLPVLAANLPEFVLTDDQGQPLSDAVVVIKQAEGAPLPEPADAAVDQLNLAFVPEVTVVQAGAMVRFPNSDDTRHHVYSFSDAKTFEIQLYRSDDAPPIEFDRTGLVVLGCNIHDGMRGFIYVVDSHLYGVTDEHGRVTLPPLTAHEGAQVMFWHPQMADALELPLMSLPNAQGSELIIPLPFTFEAPGQNPAGTDLRNRLQRFRSSGS
ncbi:MAG: methylamine utilization protein [Saccharospirillum sp.]|nr:methylamine utilization protein [Saccharospirillum sp.]